MKILREKKRRFPAPWQYFLLTLWSILLLWALLPCFRNVFNYGTVLALILFPILIVITILFYPICNIFKYRFNITWKRIICVFLLSVSFLSVGAVVFLSCKMAIAAAVVPPKEPELPVIILGCQINGDQPASTMKRRLTVALSYLVAHPNSNCVVSGGTGSDEDYSEAYVMKKWLTENGISPERILSEDQSHNTEQNIKNSLQLLRKQGYCGAVAIATDNWHQLRASQWVKWEGASSYAVSCSSQWDLVFVFWLREMMADARLFLFHR